jgi:hypothetical protein
MFGVTQYLLDKIDLDAVMPLVCRFIHRDWLSDGKSMEDDALVLGLILIMYLH